ncbi:o-succinylbenzoate--CoA ligase [Cryobacterium algoricola]|uniref:O-succinylbenzoate--CoA ligase n=1 Tax=Cryobacterium algoricola TaxID=1259183 RepID=A0ABY2IFT7_9MICO|nr:AMP-binding protein [Cryobacterium algoricola]TFB87731.1 o-succinylbenzoate--CoA ligase [Cryobacterium algoricola]
MLRVVPVDRPLDLLDLLREALSGRGDALLPVPVLTPTLPETDASRASSAESDASRASFAGTHQARLARNGATGARVPVSASLPVTSPVPGTVPDGTVVVIETSGSTGVPKRVLLGAPALRASAAASSAALGGPGQWLLALPAHYVAGVQVLIRSLEAGTTPVVLAPGHFDPAEFLAAATRLTAPLRYTSLVPVQLARLLDAVDAAAADAAPHDGGAVGAADEAAGPLALLRRFTAILVGGQAVPPELIARSAAHGITVVRTYGSSETAGGCCYNGRPIGDTVVRVVAGELEISGSVLADGYLDDPLRTHDRFTEEDGVRWYRTGDLGEVDAVTGLVRVLGRADNVIISGGEKVSLDAVERVVRALPGFADAVVIGATDARWGQVPVVAVPGLHAEAPTRSGVEDSPASRAAAPSVSPEASAARLAVVKEAVASVLGKAARPAQLLLVAEIPVLASGKPDRRALQRLAETGS